MSYDSSSSITSTYAQPLTARPEPAVVGALRNLGEASHALAVASDTFLAARDALNEARERYQSCRDIVAKEQEGAGV